MEKQKLGMSTDRVTIRHVAEHAGVSVAAVSKVLRNAYGVSEALRKKVEHSIDLLKYRPSMAARAMRGRTHTVGILVVELTNPFVPVLLEGIDAGLAEANYKAMVGVGRAASKLETSMIESMIDNRMDGLILIGPQMSGSVIADYASQISIVAIAHHEAHASLYDTVNSDDFLGAQSAVEALAARGYRDIAMLGYDRSDSPTSVVAVAREAGYEAAMARLGLGDKARIIRFPHPSEPRHRDFASIRQTSGDLLLVGSRCNTAACRLPRSGHQRPGRTGGDRLRRLLGCEAAGCEPVEHQPEPTGTRPARLRPLVEQDRRPRCGAAHPRAA